MSLRPLWIILSVYGHNTSGPNNNVIFLKLNQSKAFLFSCLTVLESQSPFLLATLFHLFSACLN